MGINNSNETIDLIVGVMEVFKDCYKNESDDVRLQSDIYITNLIYESELNVIEKIKLGNMWEDYKTGYTLQ